MMDNRRMSHQLLNYPINLEKRVLANHPLRKVKAAIDFGFVREEVAIATAKTETSRSRPR
jgi:ABC-type taurine transport system ATPase subunit